MQTAKVKGYSQESRYLCPCPVDFFEIWEVLPETLEDNPFKV